MSRFGNLASLICIAGLSTAVTMLPQAVSAGPRYKVLERFHGEEGRYPSGPLVADGAGNLYGVTMHGGITIFHREDGYGVVYRIALDGTYTVLYAFQNHADGYWPMGNLLLDGRGNLYGTTSRGGAGNEGTVYKLAPDGTKIILHSFPDSASDGSYPEAGLIADSAGNLYGTTSTGGANGFQGGAVFKIAPDGTETVLYSFCSASNCADGYDPEARLLLDANGSLASTTSGGGAFDSGTVFRLASDGTLAVLHSFGEAQNDGVAPHAGVIADSAGNLYGMTESGGQNHEGMMFEIAPDGTETILYGLSGGVSELLLDDQGDLSVRLARSSNCVRMAT